MAEEKKSDGTESNTSTLPRFYGQLGGDLNREPKQWPDLVGVAGAEAENKIKEDMPEAKIHIVPHDSFITMDYRTDRVRIFVYESGKVVKPPTIG